MILIGQYDSPFVRRVAIAMRLYGIEFERRTWSVWADADTLATRNPLRRVPTLVLDHGETLIESSAILDHLDELVGPERALIPPSGPMRRRVLNFCALSTGLADKAVSLFYEPLVHASPSQIWMDRCRAQITGVLTWLEACRVGIPAPYWRGPDIGHDDIAMTCAIRFTREAHPDLFDAARYPELAAHAERCEALEAFQAIRQPITVRMEED